MQTKYSIITPVYNSADYLEKCINSIISLRFTQWELILVDDGSTDDSELLVDKYADVDSRIIAVHQPNAGPGAARNRGIEIARGDFIVFVDSDDWVDPFFLDDYEIAGDEWDIVYQGHWKEYDTGESKINIELKIDTLDIPYAIKELWEHDYFGYTCMKRFRRKLIRENHISFNTSVFFREDTIFTAQYFRHVKSVSVLPVANYHYRYLDSSLQHTRFNVKEMLYADDLIFEAFSIYFDDEDFRNFTEHWYLVNLHNGIKKSFVGENRRVFTDIERKELIEKCIQHRQKIDDSGFRYSNNPILNYLLMVLWATSNEKLILKGLRWLMQ